jgi:hypothetical protein
MFEIGNNLRAARIRQKLELSQAEGDTRIRAKYLRALEDERFEVLPGPAYTKGFLRTYADYLGLDAQRFVEEYNARLAPEEEPEAPPQLRIRRRRRFVPAPGSSNHAPSGQAAADGRSDRSGGEARPLLALSAPGLGDRQIGLREYARAGSNRSLRCVATLDPDRGPVECRRNLERKGGSTAYRDRRCRRHPGRPQRNPRLTFGFMPSGS